MKLSLSKVLSRKNLNLAVGLIALMVFLWLISYAIPSLFVQMFDTGLGNLILLGIVALASMANINLGVGLLIMFFILYRFAHMSGRRFEGFNNIQLALNAATGKTDADTLNYMTSNSYASYTDGQINAMTKEQLTKAIGGTKKRLSSDLATPSTVRTNALNSLKKMQNILKTMS